MRKLLTITLTAALPALLATAVVAGCDGAGPDAPGARPPDRSADDRSAADRPATTTGGPDAPAGPTTTAAPSPGTADTPDGPAGPTTTDTVPPAPDDGGERYLCPEGGIDAVREVQSAVDQGHQPWRLSPEDVAAACTFGLGASTVEPAGTDTYRVTDTATGEQRLVTVAQPLGPGTIWAVTQSTPA